MTESSIFELIGGLAGGQVYPYVAPLNAQGAPAITAPWIVFTVVSEVFGDTLCGPAEENGSLQVDVYASSTDEARSIREAVATALAPLHFTQLNKTNGYESDTGLFRATLEIQSQQ
ncbi:tail completion protein gp17 [Candidatus Pantoea formicae]|uniref:tail completion protein gp17 n=1 Tax=Candidatus Pantoea formicae TaxID=2608355 RepID=UPI003EDB01F2